MITSPYRRYPSFAEWTNRPVSVRYWEEALDRLQTERANATPEQLDQAATVIARAAAVDTSAIEGFYEANRGFTMSVAQQVAGWQAAFDERGETARSMFDAQLRTSELVFDAATKHLPITEALVRSLHEHACAAQSTYRVQTAVGFQDQPLIRGAYKTLPNNPVTAEGRVHAYAPVDTVAPEMARLVEHLRSPAFEAAPAPIQAAFAHYSLVAVHPFADGNGRVARALASVFLRRATSVPLLIFVDQKAAYLDALADADAGDYAAFSTFVVNRSLDALGLLDLELQRVKSRSIDDIRREANRLHLIRPGLTHTEVDGLAVRLLHEAARELKEAFSRLELPRAITLSTKVWNEDRRGPLAGYRGLAGQQIYTTLQVAITSAAPGRAETQAIIVPQVARDPEHPRPVRLEDRVHGLILDVRIEDVVPELSASFRLQLQSWGEAVLHRMIEQVMNDGKAAAEKAGWGG